MLLLLLLLLLLSDSLVRGPATGRIATVETLRYRNISSFRRELCVSFGVPTQFLVLIVFFVVANSVCNSYR